MPGEGSGDFDINCIFLVVLWDGEMSRVGSCRTYQTAYRRVKTAPSALYTVFGNPGHA